MLAALTGLILFTNCAKDRTTPVDPVLPPNPEEYPNFATTTNFALDVDYELTGDHTLIKVYTEFPYIINENGSVTKKELNPVFAIYSNDNGKFSGNITLPSATEKVYLCTHYIGLPQCVDIPVTNRSIKFKLSDFHAQTAQAQTKGDTGSPSGRFPYLLDESKQLFSSCTWQKYGKPVLNSNYVLKDVSNSVTSRWIRKLKNALGYTGGDKSDNSKWVVDEKYTNISIAKRATNDKGEIVDVIDAKIFLTFIDETASYQNTFGYYYYPTDRQPTDPGNLKKYVIFPNTSTAGNVPFMPGSKFSSYSAPLKPALQVALKYIDNDGKIHDRFPAGYTIGWFVISNAFTSSSQTSKNKLDTDNPFIYSNASFNSDKQAKCITLSDKETGRVIIGFEDGGDTSYDDILFFVNSDPTFAIQDPNKPSIDDEGDIEVPDGVEETAGTLAFEDLWPAKGDYDMNDVIVEYKRIITFDKDNKVKKIRDSFKPVHLSNSSAYINAFAYQVATGQTGTYTLENGIQYESATNSFILFTDSKEARNKEFVLNREFSGSASFNKTDFKEYNPFIIPNYTGKVPRAEVHLPKHKPTAHADKTLLYTKNDAYYVDKEGQYPFAILLPILNFTPVLEGNPIGSQGQYADFTKWVQSGCKEYNDWYKRKE